MSSPRGPDRVRIVLVRPIHPGNVGSAARAMANMGLDDLVVVDPPCLDLERARWMAAGGRDVLENARFVATVAEAIEGCSLAMGTTARIRRWNWPVYLPQQAADRALSEDRCAILFGREDHGLDNDSLAHCQALLRIPTAGEPSLNLGQAVLLTCSRMFDAASATGWRAEEKPRQGKRSGGPTKGGAVGVRKTSPPATLEFQSVVLDRAMELLNETPYMRGRSDELVRVTLSQMLHRAQPSSVEIEILLGMVKKTRWQLDNG